ncbi:MAG: PLP-dependent aspartate aminotransferase family protein [Woeseiaceae bacterium]|nr:PLP-dependent aspartate aminotransferase family protein [Woeseiaceae bacterium]
MGRKTTRQTDIAQGLHYIDPETGSVIPPVVASTTFARDEQYQLVGGHRSYSRDHNPTFDLAEQMLSRLEGGHEALLFSSGMAAAAAVFQSLKPGDHVVYPKVMYWGLRGWLLEFAERWGLNLTPFDATDPDDLHRRVQPGVTRLVWIETPCNPTWDVIDIEGAAELAHDAGAVLAVDSTVATPVLTRPIELGADIVMHSATKYLNGHGDVLAGALVAKEDSELWRDVKTHRAETGAIPGSMDAWLLQRGMRTLFLRVSHASSSALAIARHFEGSPALASVAYPGLESHAGHEVAKRQMHGGFSGMLSFLVNGDEHDALRFVSRCQVFIRATSLGGVESLIEHRYSIEGPDSPIPKNLVRLSVGAEHVDDLIADLEQALR